ncbi:cytochrome c oxidase subunit II [Fulvimarina endophytica]|uniref:Cytochrome aa3 subunit 2 n=1 Tax=Fulvimarina endophytica TaxID=2293836 RepID=A0A371X7R1_9HYPH|nr:cytochrome c oxidase subunit II [Fulvimarina endophytica]RFC65289.1 cytochrome c oxidase subunit II [Fulvimarina endophytica]
MDPAGPSAAAIADLWWWMLAGSVLLSGLVFVILFLAFRRAGRAERSDAPSEKLWLGWLGLAMPVVVLLALLTYALHLGGRILPGPDAPDLTVEVTAYNWGWSFRYPDGRVSERVLHIPADAKIDLVISATDVIHSFWVPRLAGKMDAIPGHVNELRIEADRPGTFAGVCAEYCGIGHVDHDFQVIAHDGESWQDFLENRE